MADVGPVCAPDPDPLFFFLCLPSPSNQCVLLLFSVLLSNVAVAVHSTVPILVPHPASRNLRRQATAGRNLTPAAGYVAVMEARHLQIGLSWPGLIYS